MTSSKTQAGMTLIELMVAMLVGLFVIGATVGLAVALMQNNNETIRSTRLTQELRATADIVAAEVRRARSLSDPLAVVGQGTAASQACNAIYPAPGDVPDDCLLFGYDCDPSTGEGQFRMIRSAGTNLVMASGTSALTCGTAGTRLNSGDVVIDDATFSTNSEGAIEVTLEGHLASDEAISRKITRTVWPRSVAVTP